MSWLFFYALLGILFALQLFWRSTFSWNIAPDWLFLFLLALSLLGKRKRIFFLILPVALLRAAFSLEPTLSLLATLFLMAFFLQLGRSVLHWERISMQWGLAFFVSGIFLCLQQWSRSGENFSWMLAVGNAAVSASFAPLLFWLLRNGPKFRPLIEKGVR